MKRFLRRLCVVTVLCVPTLCYAVDRPYCGLYCLYAAMRIQGSGAEFEKLLDPNYISHPEGSSLRELKQAAEDRGLTATPVKNLSPANLKRIHAPVIIHVRGDVEQKGYKHFVLYLGEQCGKAIILDPPGPLKWLRPSELASIWDGTGLVISRAPVDLGAVFAPARRRCILWMVVVTAGVAGLRFARRCLPSGMFMSRIRRLGLSTSQGVVLSVAALMCAFGYHFIVEEGFLAHAGATEGIQRTHAGGFIRKVGADSVEDMLGDAIIFVDARFKRDFDAGHMEGALSIPVNATDEERRKTLASVARNMKIVVYCQSRACQFAEKTALRLRDDGFSDVVVYRGGWVDWVTRNGKKNTEDKS